MLRVILSEITDDAADRLGVDPGSVFSVADEGGEVVELWHPDGSVYTLPRRVVKRIDTDGDDSDDDVDGKIRSVRDASSVEYRGEIWRVVAPTYPSDIGERPPGVVSLVEHRPSDAIGDWIDPDVVEDVSGDVPDDEQALIAQWHGSRANETEYTDDAGRVVHRERRPSSPDEAVLVDVRDVDVPPEPPEYTRQRPIEY